MRLNDELGNKLNLVGEQRLTPSLCFQLKNYCIAKGQKSQVHTNERSANIF